MTSSLEESGQRTAKMRAVALHGLALAALLFASAGACAQVVNGGFETGPDPGIFALGLAPGDPRMADGWTIESGTIDYIVESSTGGANFDLGGGGIYSGQNATLTRVDSTFSGNTSVAWHGGGVFHTDGHLTVDHSTFAENAAPAGTASGVLVGSFGAPANAVIRNSVMQANRGTFACAIFGGGDATITSFGGNVIGDGSCNPAGADQPFTDALLEMLSDNGGPTLTHALLVGSPAVDAAAGAGFCPATDQRGVLRPQGGGLRRGCV